MTSNDMVPDHTGERTPAALVFDRFGDDSDEFEVGDLRLSPHRRLALLDGREIGLTNKEFLLLALLARNPGRVLRRAEIAGDVWRGHAPGRTIDIHIARLRAKLPPGSITTVVRVGYRFTLA